MKIILWGINYRPESTGIAPYNAELAEFLTERKHDVTVVTGFSYYPHWRKDPADRGKLFNRERINGVDVCRCAQYVPRTATTLRRIFHELSFGIMSLLRVLFLPRADVYVVVSPPLCLGFFAWVATSVKRSRYVFHVQDLQPDAAVGLGMVNGRGFIRLLYGLEAFSYRQATAVSGISDGMMSEFRRKGLPARKLIFFPNWLRKGTDMARTRGAFREKFGVSADNLLAVYSGNLGRKQGIEILLEAAQRLANENGKGASLGNKVTIAIIGAGAERDALAAQVAAMKLPNLRLLPLLSDDDYAQMLADADVGLITQASGTGQYFFPSKLLSLLQAGLPVATVADDSSELARAVRDGGFGVNVNPGQAGALASALQRLADDVRWRADLRGRTRWVQRFGPSAVLPQFAAQLERIADATAAGTGMLHQHELSRP